MRPLARAQTAWWFTPRLASAQIAQPAAAPRSESGVTEMFRNAPMGMALASDEGRLVEANRAFASFLGTQGALQGRSFSELVEASDRASVSALIGERAAGSIELRAGQGERTAELYVHPLRDGRLALYLFDVSEQKALETKFAQSQKLQAVGQLAGGVAHDFNNLLTVIIGNSEFLLMRHHAGDPSFKEINEIHQNALRAATLVGQLLAFSRKQTLQP